MTVKRRSGILQKPLAYLGRLNSIYEGTEQSIKWLLDVRGNSVVQKRKGSLRTKEILGVVMEEEEDLRWNKGRVDFIFAVQKYKVGPNEITEQLRKENTYGGVPQR